jgi:NADH:ubiquinone oxidoreductase subunit 3 (subunit A)
MPHSHGFGHYFEIITYGLMLLLIGIGNNTSDIGKFQCGFEDNGNGGEIDFYRILLLFIIFEVECVFLVIWVFDVGLVVFVIVRWIIWEVVIGEIV